MGLSANPSELPSALPGWSAVPSNSEGDRLLINRRIGYFGGVFFLISAAFYIRSTVLISVMEQSWPPLGHPTLLLHLAAMSVAGLQWLSCRTGRRSPKELNLIDVGGLLGSMALYAALTIAEAAGFEHALVVQSAGAEILLMVVVMMALVLTHAIIVPASVQRMLWLSSAACAFGPLAAYVIARVGAPPEYLAQKPWMPWMQTLYVTMWAVLTVVVATIAARVIHGLSQRVREANEIGQYRLEEKIGEGGMGVVYLARHALLRRPTAVKLLSAERAGENAVRRFEQEVQLTSALTHPNTIAIFDFGRTPDGVFYYAMEYLDGITLEDLVRHEGAQPPARVVKILEQICGALAEAHDSGLVHRDIKPANLMLCVRGRVPDQIKVLDFGLVKEQDAGASVGLSMTGALVGTPGYLAPEAIMNPERVDARTDLYALGAVGYYLLTGHPVFSGATLIELCGHHLCSEPVRPSHRTERPIPAALELLIMACLAKDPSARPGSASELGGALAGLEDIGAWSNSEARSWWQLQAPVVQKAVKTRVLQSSTPGPLSVAIDLSRRATR